MSDLVRLPIILAGGLQDSKAQPEPGDLQKSFNIALFRGRFALRAPVFQAVDLSSILANITSVLNIVYHNGSMYAVVFRSASSDVRLVQMNTDGSSPVDKGVIWATAVQPRPILSSFEGGSDTAGVQRLYIADFDEQQLTKFWDGATISNVTEDLNDDNTKENLQFHYVFGYNFHMWGAGFNQGGSSSRKELLRFSQPGMIPANEPNVTFNPLREWWGVDKRGVGIRGDKIMGAGFAGGNAVIFKKTRCYALFGFDRDSWAVKLLSERVGAVGPYAFDSTGDGLCFFWSERGPQMTDGDKVIDISEDIRKRVLDSTISDKHTVGFSSDDGLVYFNYPKGGSAEPDHWAAFDKERGKWTEGEWYKTAGGVLLQVAKLTAVSSTVLPGPLAAPTGLTATVFDETTIDLAWTNQDLALDTTTEIYRALTATPTVLVKTVGSGVTTWHDTDAKTQGTPYFYRIRHVRNQSPTAYTSDATAHTALAKPTLPFAQRLSNGIRFGFTNNAAGADLSIERAALYFTVNGQVSPGSYEVITTLAAQSTGVKTYDDTSASLVSGGSYLYRVQAIKAGETTSVYSDVVTQVRYPAISITSITHSFFLPADCSGFSRENVNWTVANALPGDQVNVYRQDDGGAFVKIATVPAQDLGYSQGTLRKVGGTAISVHHKVEAIDSQGNVISTLTTGSPLVFSYTTCITPSF